MIKTYTIPEEIRKLMTYDFLKEFRNQLFTIFNFSLETYANTVYGVESTTGWANALKDACHNTGKDDIWNYWNNLEWYDSDVFDSELSDMLIKNRLILPTMDDIFKNYLNAELEDLRVCEYCGGTFTKDMVIERTESDLPWYSVDVEDGIVSDYICKYCSRHHKEG